ncbi:hypothetical protein GN956_G9249 [Arapaima gigas]
MKVANSALSRQNPSAACAFSSVSKNYIRIYRFHRMSRASEDATDTAGRGVSRGRLSLCSLEGTKRCKSWCLQT